MSHNTAWGWVLFDEHGFPWGFSTERSPAGDLLTEQQIRKTFDVQTGDRCELVDHATYLRHLAVHKAERP